MKQASQSKTSNAPVTEIKKERVGSVIPVSCHETESCVLPIGMDKAWHLFKEFKLESVLPSKVK